MLRILRGARPDGLARGGITRRGLSLLARIDPEIERTMATATASLSGDQLRQIARLCSRLVP